MPHCLYVVLARWLVALSQEQDRIAMERLDQLRVLAPSYWRMKTGLLPCSGQVSETTVAPPSALTRVEPMLSDDGTECEAQ